MNDGKKLNCGCIKFHTRKLRNKVVGNRKKVRKRKRKVTMWRASKKKRRNLDKIMMEGKRQEDA